MQKVAAVRSLNWIRSEGQVNRILVPRPEVERRETEVPKGCLWALPN